MLKESLVSSRGEQGFTLVETLVALLIVGLAAALTLPAIAQAVGRSAASNKSQSLAEQAQSVLALAKAEASLGNGAFADWQVVRSDLGNEDPTTPNTAYWLQATHVPTGRSYRILVVG